MANAQAVATAFKVAILEGHHAFGTSVVRAGTGADSFKAALFLASASLGAASATYSVTGEVSGAGYTAGGIAVTNATPPSSTGTTAFWTPSADLVFSAVTLTTAFDCVQIYNDTSATKEAVATFTFGSQTITAGTLTLGMPVNDATTGLLRAA